MTDSETWYVVKQENGQCVVLPSNQIKTGQEGNNPTLQQWGPYPSQTEAIARRVGLIRAGKCQPI